jgi:hypothetical protein
VELRERDKFANFSHCLEPRELKSLTAILLLFLLAFNWVGYRMFMNLLEQKASLSLQQQLDNEQYDDKNLVEVKIPINLPYLSNWSSFEKFQGETEINGIYYKYVKRRLVNDTLILLCIPNTEKNELRIARSDFFKQVNDLPSNNNKTSSGKDQVSKAPTVDYLLNDASIEIVANNALPLHHSAYSDKLSLISRLVAEQPPDC